MMSSFELMKIGIEFLKCVIFINLIHFYPHFGAVLVFIIKFLYTFAAPLSNVDNMLHICFLLILVKFIKTLKYNLFCCNASNTHFMVLVELYKILFLLNFLNIIIILISNMKLNGIHSLMHHLFMDRSLYFCFSFFLRFIIDDW